MHTMELSVLLADGLAQLGLELDENQQQQLLAYLALLHKWNQAYNLTAIRKPADMVRRHLLDSLSIHAYIKGPRIIDVGSGAGLPGIPLAMALPQLEFVLLDSNGKKTRFLQQVINELGLLNVSVVCQRAEQYQPEQLFQTVTCRAFSDLATIWRSTRHLLSPTGMILAMKGQVTNEELSDLPQGIKVSVIPLLAPCLGASRQLVEIQPV
jgi:16S rRNA (guanine527-N7)-methyltransferase